MIVQRPVSFLSVFVFLSLSASCSGESASTIRESYTVRDSAGVEIVTNHRPQWQPGEEWRIADDPDVELGQLEGADVELFTTPSARLLADRRILVSEQSEKELRLFSPDGTWLWTAGGKGEGPGEFKFLEKAQIVPGDTILVFDRGLRRATWFDSSGEFVRSVQVSTGDRSAFCRGVLDPNTWLFESMLPSSDSAGVSRWQREIQLVGSAGIPLATLDTLTTDLSLSETKGNHSLIVTLPFFGRPIFAAGEGKAYITDNTSWEIRVFDQTGTFVRLIRRDWIRQPVTAGDIELRLDRERGFQANWNQTEDQNRAGLRLLEEGARRSASIPPLYQYWVDRVGNLWTLDWYMPEWPHPEREFNVFNPSGIWLGSVTVPAGMGLSDVGDDYVVATVGDDLGVRRVRVHKLIKPATTKQDS